MNNQVVKIAEELIRHSSILLSIHRDPDGDGLGSQLALMLALEKMGKAVTAHNLDPVPEPYRFLPHWDRIKTGRPVKGTYDVLMILDCEPGRSGLYDGIYPAKTLINIDHHTTNPVTWPLTWLAPDVAATGEMAYKLINEMKAPMDKEIALCLFTAIFTDTGSFRYTNTTPESMRVSAALLEFGLNPWLVAENVYETFEYDRIKLLGSVLVGMERSADGRIAWVVIPEALYRQTRTTAKDTENFINYVRSVKGVEVAVLFRQTAERQYKVSLRSKGRVDVSGIAQAFGGGGHENAAGCILDGTLEEIKRTVLSRVEKALTNEVSTR